jgi:hypothetical protein
MFKTEKKTILQIISIFQEKIFSRYIYGMYGLIWSGHVGGGFSKYKLECYLSTSNKS